MDVLLVPLLELFNTLTELYIWAVIISTTLSWLAAFNIINTYNRYVYAITSALYRLTEPALMQIRRILPHLGGLDLSPLALILGLHFVRKFVNLIVLKLLT